MVLRCVLAIALLMGGLSAAQLAASAHSSPARADVSTGTAGLFVPTQGSVLDTRTGIGGVSGPVTANQWYPVQVAGQAGVPATGVSSVQVSITVLTPAATGLVKAAANGTAVVPVAALTYTGGGGSISASSIVALAADGKIEVLAQTSVTLLVHVQGYYTAGNGTLAPGGYVPVSPARLVDTRNGTGLPQAKLALSSTTAITVGGLGNVPADASAVFVMFTLISTSTTAGYFSPYPAGATRPGNVSLNYLANTSTILGAAVDLGTGGQFNLWVGPAGTAIDLVVDVVGYYTATAGTGGAFTPASARAYDSRIAPSTAVAANSSRVVPVGGVAGVPTPDAGIGAYALSAQIVHTGSSAGSLALGTGDQPTAAVASLYFSAGSNVRSDLVIVPAAADGTVLLVNSSPDPINVILDVVGWFALSAPAVASSFYLSNAQVTTPYTETAADFSWMPNRVGTAAYRYSEDGGSPVTTPDLQTELAWYPAAPGPHTLRVWTVNTNGVVSPVGQFNFVVAPDVPPNNPEFLQTAGTTTPLLSGVISSSSGSELDADFYLTDASGLPVGQSPYATAAMIPSGHRAALAVPAGVLTAGNTYHWSMSACSPTACSAPSQQQSFTYSPAAAPSDPTGTTVVVPAGTAQASAAPTGSTACSGSPCAQTVDSALRVGSDGNAVWRSYLKFDLSSLPAGARVVSATLTLGTPTTIGPAGSIDAVDLYAMGASWTANTTGDVLPQLADPAAAASASTASAAFDVADLVQTWLSGDHPNFGLTLAAANPQSGYESSFPSPSVTNGAPQLSITYQTATAPSAPTDLSVVSGDGAALVSWSPPADQGNSVGEVSYTVTASTATGTLLSSRTTSAVTAVLTGLSNGTAVTISVTAGTSFGSSPAVTAMGTPTALSGSAPSYVESAREYLAARDRLSNGSADTPVDALTGMPNAAAVLDQLTAEAGSILGARQERVVHDAGLPSGGDPQVSNAVVGIVPGSDKIGVWVDVADSVSDGGTQATASRAQLMLRFSATGQLDGSYSARDTRPAGPTSLDATAEVADATATPSAFSAGTTANAPVPVAEDPSSWPSTAAPTAEATAASIAVPAYRHSLNQSSMVAWADQHYDDPYQYHPDCTGWASRALHEGGGMAYKLGWYRSDQNWWRKRSIFGVKQTHSYNNAQSMANFLGSIPGKWITSTGLAQPGDILFYRFNDPHQGGDKINHTAVIVENNRQWGLYVAQSDTNYSYRSVNTALAALQQGHGRVTLYIRRVYNSNS